MQITDYSKEQVLLGLERLRGMAPSANILSPHETDLSISLSGSSARVSSKPNLANPHYQVSTQPLDLLPLYPPHSSALLRPEFAQQESATHQGVGSHSQLLFGRPVQYPTIPSARQASSPASMSRCVSIDMNQIPSSSESDEGEDQERGYRLPHRSDSMHKQRSEVMEGSPINSCMKREREKMASENMNNNAMYEVSSRASDEEDGGSTRKKLRLTKEQSALLEESFKEHSTLNPKQKNALAKQLNLRPRQVEVWFQNRRARTKLKQTELDCELLKRCCESLTEENRRLQKEVQELRALKVGAPCVIAHDFYMPLPAATLTMCPSCERIGSLDPSVRPPVSSNKQSAAPHLLQQPSLAFNPHHPQPSAACS